MADYLTVEQAAETLGLSIRMVQYLINTGAIEAKKYDPDKVTSPWLIDPASVKAYQKQKAAPAKAAK